MGKRYERDDLKGARDRVIEAAREIEKDWAAFEDFDPGALLDALGWLRLVEHVVGKKHTEVIES